MKSNIWFPFYTAEFISKTYFLSQAQKGAYLNLLVWYYENAQPIPCGFAYAAADVRTEEDKTNTDVVLLHFFKKDGEVWRQAKCDKILTDISHKRETQRLNGVKGGRPSKPKDNPDETHGLANSNPNETQIQLQPHLQSHIKDQSVSLGGQVGSFEKKGGWNVLHYLSPQALDTAKDVSVEAGWDFYVLVTKYNGWIRKKGIPDNIDRAFLGWMVSFTKKNNPS